jgi:hypothetical protein
MSVARIDWCAQDDVRSVDLFRSGSHRKPPPDVTRSACRPKR